jgi:hypothetical protein
MSDEPGPTADPEKIEKKKRSRKQQDLDFTNWMTVTLGSYEGRAVVWSLIEESKLFHTSFAGEQPMGMAFREGRKHMGQFLFTWVLQSAPDAYKLMEKENKARLVKVKAQED